jgi:hypothetical protein
VKKRSVRPKFFLLSMFPLYLFVYFMYNATPEDRSAEATMHAAPGDRTVEMRGGLHAVSAGVPSAAFDEYTVPNSAVPLAGAQATDLWAEKDVPKAVMDESPVYGHLDEQVTRK